MIKGFGNSTNKKTVKRKTPVQNIEFIVEKTIGEYFAQQGLSRELGQWIYRGIGRDCRENWSEEKFFEWVEVGKAKYGFKPEHHQMVNDLSAKIAREFNDAA